MLLTVTLNLAIDKTYNIDHLLPGKVQRIRESAAQPGGKGINVSRVAAELGEDVVATGFAGGFNGQYIRAELAKQPFRHDFQMIAEESRLCLNILSADGSSTELLEPGPTVTRLEIEGFLEKFYRLTRLAKVVTLSGSIPFGLPVGIYCELIQIAKKNGAVTLLDTSGDALVEGLQGRPDFVKPNKEELERTTKLKFEEDKELVNVIRSYLHKGIGCFVVSLGADGSIIGTGEGFYRVKPPHIRAVNTVGCGDALVAGFAVALAREMPLPEAIRLATAAAASNALHGDAGIIEKEQVENLINQVIIEQLFKLE